MLYENWMSFIRPEVKLTKLVMPGAHNAGSYGMNATACCQDGTLYEQAKMGVRHFCIRLNTDKKGRVIMSHGIAKGASLDSALCDLRKAFDEFPDEFFILDIREYYPQTFGPVTLHFEVDAQAVNELVKKHLEPEKYCLYDFDNIADVTMGDIKKAGKRFMMVHYIGAYKYSVACENILPWEKQLYGMKTENFVKKVTTVFDINKTDGLYWFQTQQTPNLGTEIGFKTPRKLDEMLRPMFTQITDTIANNPFYLESANIISGDFMTYDKMKCSCILKLNLAKGNVIEEKVQEFAEGLK